MYHATSHISDATVANVTWRDSRSDISAMRCAISGSRNPIYASGYCVRGSNGHAMNIARFSPSRLVSLSSRAQHRRIIRLLSVATSITLCYLLLYLLFYHYQDSCRSLYSSSNVRSSIFYFVARHYTPVRPPRRLPFHHFRGA